MTTVRVPKLYRPTSEVYSAGAYRVLTPSDVLWCHGSRASSLGGYIGTFTMTYPHKNKAGEIVGYSPVATPPSSVAFQLHMGRVEAMPDGGPLTFS